MSKTKFVEYASKRNLGPYDVGPGFWAYDVALNIFLKHLIDAAEASEHADAPWLSSAIYDWRVACVPDHCLTIDSDWPPEQQQVFLGLAEKACVKLAEREAISSDEIDSWEIFKDLRHYTRGAAEPTGPVIELGRAIIALVHGLLPEAPEGRIWLYGFPGGCQTLGWKSAKDDQPANIPQPDHQKKSRDFPFLSTVRAFFQRLRK